MQQQIKPILNRTVAPASAPVPLADLKTHLNIEHTDDDTYITALAAAVVDQIETKLKRAVITQTWTQSQRCPNGANVVWLEMPPVQTLVSVKYYDMDFNLVTATLADFTMIDQTDGFKIVRPMPGKPWPPHTTDRDDALIVEFTAGNVVADVPLAMKHAIKLLVGSMYSNREAVTDVRLREFPFGVSALLEPYRSKWVA